MELIIIAVLIVCIWLINLYYTVSFEELSKAQDELNRANKEYQESLEEIMEMQDRLIQILKANQ